MQTLSALCNAPVVGLQAPTCDGVNSAQRDEILEVNQMKKLIFQSGVLMLLLTLILPVAYTYAADELESVSMGNWQWTATLGAVSWRNLESLEPAAGGEFNSLGFAMELAGHKHVTRWGSADVLVGADLGLFTTESSISGFQENFTQRGLYLTPSMKLRFGDRNVKYMNLEVGLGWYEMDIAELDCTDFCTEFDEPFNSDVLGGYLGISSGFGTSFVMGLKAHFVDFGPVTGLGPNTGDLNGPVYIFSAGFAFGG